MTIGHDLRNIEYKSARWNMKVLKKIELVEVLNRVVRRVWKKKSKLNVDSKELHVIIIL